MSKRDYYEVLGVERDADQATIKKAYRRIAMKFHPDRNSEDPKSEEKFKEASEAYEVLADADKRQTYDRFGHAGVEAGAAGGGQGFNGGGFGDIFGDVFGDIFGGSRGPARGSDLQYRLDITLEQAVGGTNAKINIPTTVGCDLCEGSGAKPGTKVNTCGTCAGRGQVRMQQGFFSVQQACPNCRGRGQVIEDPCRKCQGQGMVREKKTLSVNIPAGVDTGDRIRLSGEGEGGPAGTIPGDLYVQVAVKEHPIFERQGADLYCDIPVSIIDAALGAEVEVPTLNGRVKLKIPAETQTGKLFRLRGKGVKPLRSAAIGDLMCRVLVETPVNLSAKQRELLEQLRQSFGESKHAPARQRWFDGVKKFFDDLAG